MVTLSMRRLHDVNLSWNDIEFTGENEHLKNKELRIIACLTVVSLTCRKAVSIIFLLCV